LRLPVSCARLPPSPAQDERSVLIVDDDAFAREALGRILEVDGYHVLRAANGLEALKHLQGAQRPGLILLDLFMPQLDGFEFVWKQKHDPMLADIPVIVVSAADQTAVQEPCACVVARFQKPVIVADLLQAIRRQLPPM